MSGCVYCGAERKRYRVGERVVELAACHAHEDLLRVDPNYGLAVTLDGKPPLERALALGGQLEPEREAQPP